MTQYWEPGTAYNDGDVVEYEGHHYKIIQPHTSQPDRVPSVSPALWGHLSDQDHNQGSGGDVVIPGVAHTEAVSNLPVQPRATNPPRHKPKGRPELDWSVSITFDAYELGCNYAVIIFLGDVPSDPQDWLICDTFVGAAYTYISSSLAVKCRELGGDYSTNMLSDCVNLNRAIARRSGLTSFEPGVVVPYLTRALQWRVQRTDGPPAELESLEVSVVCTPLSYPPGAVFSVPGEPCYYNSITDGRPGGRRHA